MDTNQLENALRNAHRVGDIQAARRLASAIKRQRQGDPFPTTDVPDGMMYNPETGQYIDTAAAAERQNQGVMGQLGTAGAIAMEGLPIAGAYVRDVAGMGNPVQREIASRRMDQFADERPLTSTGLQVAGAVAGVAPAVAAAPAAFGAGGGGFVANTALAGASGAGIGAADAAARSGGDLTAIKTGAALGGGIGMLGPGVAAGSNKAFQSAKNLFRGKGARAEAGANRVLNRALSRDSMTPEELSRQLAALGSDAVPADVSPSLRQQAEGLASMQGPAQKTVHDALNQRAEAASSRISNALDDALGQPVNTLQTADDIIAQRSAAATPLYDAARSKPVPFTRELEQLLQRPAMRRALKEAQGLAADEGMASQQWFINIADDGTTAINSVPDVRQLDYTKRALDDMIDAAGPQTNKGRILNNLKRQLTDIVDSAVPEYAEARQAFARPSGVLDAMEAGKSVFRNSQTPEHIRRQLATLEPAEREGFLQGAREAVADAMGTARNDANAAKALFEKGYNQEKLSLLIGEQQARTMLSRLNAERTFSQTRNQVTGNSRTASRHEVMRDLGPGTNSSGPVRSTMNFQFGDAAASVGDRIARTFNAPGVERRNEALAQALMQRSSRFPKATQGRGGDMIKRRGAMIHALTATGGVNP